MWNDTIRSLGISVATVFVVIFLFTGFNIREALVILITIVMVTADLGG